MVPAGDEPDFAGTPVIKIEALRAQPSGFVGRSANTPGLDRVALVHDRLDQAGGAERMLWTLHTMFPDAPIFTAITDSHSLA